MDMEYTGAHRSSADISRVSPLDAEAAAGAAEEGEAEEGEEKFPVAISEFTDWL